MISLKKPSVRSTNAPFKSVPKGGTIDVQLSASGVIMAAIAALFSLCVGTTIWETTSLISKTDQLAIAMASSVVEQQNIRYEISKMNDSLKRSSESGDAFRDQLGQLKERVTLLEHAGVRK